jgi:CarD family transcriptional regulator
MKKISLKNILKKTFKKSKKQKKIKNLSILKKSKVSKIKASKKIPKKTSKTKAKIKINLINKKIKINKKINIANKKIKIDNKEIKVDNLRISKSNEIKPEIKKIKKQETAKKEYKPKDYIVYPKHGVGQILSINSKTIGGIEVQCYDIKFEKDKAVGLLPINKQSHLRPLATINQVNKSISILKSKPKIKRSMWSRRAQEYEQKITSGKIYDLAEVVRDLNKGEDLLVDQSYSERQLFEKAYERILAEFQIVMNISLEETQKKLDKALKRNLENLNVKLAKKTETIAPAAEVAPSTEMVE